MKVEGEQEEKEEEKIGSQRSDQGLGRICAWTKGDAYTSQLVKV